MPNFDEPVGHTCPLIDGVIEMVGGIEYIAIARIFKGMTIEELQELFDSVSAFQYNEFVDEMEKIRSANSDLREWGNDLAEELRDALQKIEELEDAVKDLEAEVESYQEGE